MFIDISNVVELPILAEIFPSVTVRRVNIQYVEDSQGVAARGFYDPMKAIFNPRSDPRPQVFLYQIKPKSSPKRHVEVCYQIKSTSTSCLRALL